MTENREATEAFTQHEFNLIVGCRLTENDLRRIMGLISVVHSDVPYYKDEKINAALGNVRNYIAEANATLNNARMELIKILHDGYGDIVKGGE